MTNKEYVLARVPLATLDYRESMRNRGYPCWFIRCGLQGEFVHRYLYRSAKAAWEAAALSIKKSEHEARTRRNPLAAPIRKERAA